MHPCKNACLNTRLSTSVIWHGVRVEENLHYSMDISQSKLQCDHRCPSSYKCMLVCFSLCPEYVRKLAGIPDPKVSHNTQSSQTNKTYLPVYTLPLLCLSNTYLYMFFRVLWSNRIREELKRNLPASCLSFCHKYECKMAGRVPRGAPEEGEGRPSTSRRRA